MQPAVLGFLGRGDVQVMRNPVELRQRSETKSVVCEVRQYMAGDVKCSHASHQTWEFFFGYACEKNV